MWYVFTAYNTQAQYGFGEHTQAERYCDHLNCDRDINVYSYRELTGAEVEDLELDHNSLGFNFDDCDTGE